LTGMIWDNPKIFLVIVVLIVLSNGMTMLMSKIISDIAVQNADRILDQSGKNFEEIKALQMQLSGGMTSIDNKINELFFMKNASDPTTDVYVFNRTNATQ
jgi:hypothetical protein